LTALSLPWLEELAHASDPTPFTGSTARINGSSADTALATTDNVVVNVPPRRVIFLWRRAPPSGSPVRRTGPSAVGHQLNFLADMTHFA